MNSEWRPEPPATDADLAKLGGFVSDLPKDLLEFLGRSNGGEGALGLPPMWLQLYSCERLRQIHDDEFYRTEFPEYLFFASNGGLEMIAFDRANEYCVVMIDTIAGTESAVRIADNFSQVEEAIGKEFQEDA